MRILEFFFSVLCIYANGKAMTYTVQITLLKQNHEGAKQNANFEAKSMS